MSKTNKTMTPLRTFQGTIYPWNCDHMGHMNVKYYAEKFDQAVWNLFSHLGLTADYLRNNNRGMVALEQNIKYHKEVLPGDSIFIESEVLEIREKTLRMRHVMFNAVDSGLLSETEVIGLHIDTVKRKGVALPGFVTEKFDNS